MTRPDLPNPPDQSSEDLRTLFQELPRERAPGEECPTPDTLWASARGELDPAENRRVIDHTGRCPSCAEDWRLARHMVRSLEGRASGGGAGLADERPGLSWPPRWLAAAAAVMVAVLGAGILLWQQPGREPVNRDEPREAIASLVPEDQPLPRGAPTLRWVGPEGATYALVVTTMDVEILVNEQGLTGSEYTLPQSVVATLDPGTVLLWHVKAALPDGSRARSLTFMVRIE